MPGEATINEPVLPEVKMHLYRPTDPVRARITKNEICTPSRKAAGFVRHVEFDVGGTELEGNVLPGQSVGVIAPGEDAFGKPHKVRLYSVASPTEGEDGKGRILSTTVKRTIDEHWQTNKLFLGVCSNFLCDCAEGDEIMVSGPNGKRFLLPRDPEAHDYVFFATGTGIAPFRGMLKELIAKKVSSRIVLVMGAPYSTDLLYDDYFRAMDEAHENFTYLTAISRGPQADHPTRLYVQDRMETHAELFREVLSGERGLVYVCGIAGMELGILKGLAGLLDDETLEQYLRVDPEIAHDPVRWDRRMLHKRIKLTRRVMLEVYT